jgi:hypothetical protein
MTEDLIKRIVEWNSIKYQKIMKQELLLQH